MNRCLAFTSMAAPGTPIWEPDSGDREPPPSSTCKGSHVSVVNMDASRGSWQQRVCTGEVSRALFRLAPHGVRSTSEVAMRLQFFKLHVLAR